MDDTISRQAAIDIERNATVDTNPMHFEAHQKFTQFMDDAEISSFGRWQWSNGFNTALTAVGIDLKKLPPAEPHWIPVTESCECDLMDNEEVLVCQKDGQIRHAMFYDFCGKKKFVTWEEGITIYHVLAYMPMPEPYKGVTE